MPGMVNFIITMDPEASVMVERLRNVASYKIPLAIKRGMDVAMPEVIDDVKENRLSGKGPFDPSLHKLGEVTGNLKASVEPIPATMEVSDDYATVEGGIASRGIPYANIHEFGFVGSELVSAHSREHLRIRVAGSSRQRRQLRRHPQHVIRPVGAYTRNMNMPARAPFTYGMKDNLVRIKESIRTEIGHAFGNI